MDLKAVINDIDNSEEQDTIELIAHANDLVKVNFDEIPTLKEVYFMGYYSINKQPSLTRVDLKEVKKIFDPELDQYCFNIIKGDLVPAYIIDSKKMSDYDILNQLVESYFDFFMKITTNQVSEGKVYRKRDAFDIDAEIAFNVYSFPFSRPQ